VWTTAVVVGLVVACSRADSQRVVRASVPAEHLVVPYKFAAAIVGSPTRYHGRAPDLSGRLTGSVSFDGVAPTDTVVHPTVDPEICGQSLTDVSIEHRGARLGSAVVWLDGVSAGKAMPVLRRYDITTEGCRIYPRVQTATTGGTLDVRNADAASHHTRFVAARSGGLLASIPETEAGAVVPSRAVLAQTGLVEVMCDEHAWSRAWIAVFDHPYFTTTDPTGAFTIDSIPPGRYKITVWHERFGTLSDSVTVTGAGASTIDLKFKGGGTS
jgi:hypothetical protein